MLKKVILRTIVLWGAGAAMALQAAPENRPNIVWIFSDDHSIQTIGAYGGRLQKLNPTPNLDRIAKEGMLFDRCYVGNSICAPSRATLLTGSTAISTARSIIKEASTTTSSSFRKSCRKTATRQR